MSNNPLQKFNDLLEKVDLVGYRKRYQPIKIVEMDLPKEIQAVSLLYEIYWDKKMFVNFDEFYRIYLKLYKHKLEEFRKNKAFMCKNCFYRGLEARIYRTWASIITQIHAAYVAESVFVSGTVRMSEALDRAGADFQVQYKKKTLNYQVKKISFSREVRKEKPKSKQPLEGEFFDITYDVPSDSYFRNPKRKNGKYRLPYLRFKENKNLKRLPNGFVVFTPLIFEEKKKEIDAI
ncbi:MAG: Type II restriction enzyme TaqI [Candidatus Jorgensenbacteria bacterium GW2011_GWA1_48_13]|uniref:Type II restriction enzyme TaqI n=2 Tax=Candidatus Joergenseniibacteriota TaxID=1752739 RepID=A0A0G1W9F4_9BACT|nr:MAG: Type II restriction enzyme TaqI [Candidatus Jorgensenbacteria bacterium GW2011_GWA1_48_13]KKU98516.1 MAG: Type II restriction enzyme TaqI [Candidatus Jorgensenbacteria bacterium GW2011_GWC1_48_8]KKW15403.1 MAG: Type II restriction enzyme TaqI [Candidatus Jorgensenbacteria bacterium GW2011_GWB1_50_10]